MKLQYLHKKLLESVERMEEMATEKGSLIGEGHNSEHRYAIAAHVRVFTLFFHCNGHSLNYVISIELFKYIVGVTLLIVKYVFYLTVDRNGSHVVNGPPQIINLIQYFCPFVQTAYSLNYVITLIEHFHIYAGNEYHVRQKRMYE